MITFMLNHKKKLIFILVISFFTLWGSRSQLDFSVYSPDGGYRLEYYSPSKFDWIMNINMITPGRVKLYRATDNTLLGSSPVVELSGIGPAFWEIARDNEIHVFSQPGVFFKNIPLIVQGKIMPLNNGSNAEPMMEIVK
ncbi:hypothetical protein QCD60_09015 [Pokkaliibacter sp. MBI-7]|uniref:hypothetical protein n=1 Tax=Pokkaliibacter sp. MBI-7 TaxID=3040600 RepID=UPI00244C0497|nr:hypothetical protein [Pokkaliibacter sp. MBI-7]MDH2432705.1 hypothetical protein [Pokkaliibacter sp. MBI-7]